MKFVPLKTADGGDADGTPNLGVDGTSRCRAPKPLKFDPLRVAATWIALIEQMNKLSDPRADDDASCPLCRASA